VCVSIVALNARKIKESAKENMNYLVALNVQARQGKDGKNCMCCLKFSHLFQIIMPRKSSMLFIT
jgi:hypothetical protein